MLVKFQATVHVLKNWRRWKIKTIEIYDYDTGESIHTITSNKRKNFDTDVIKFLKDNHYNIILQGKISPLGNNVYWLSYNRDTKEQRKLWFREKELTKEIKPLFHEFGYRLSKEERKYYEDKGFFCYDLRCDSWDEGFIVEKNVLINHVGCIITNKDLGLTEEKRYIELSTLEKEFNEIPYEEFKKIEYQELNNELAN